MLHGYVKVVDDINKVNLDEIKKKFKIINLQGSSGGGGAVVKDRV